MWYSGIDMSFFLSSMVSSRYTYIWYGMLVDSLRGPDLLLASSMVTSSYYCTHIFACLSILCVANTRYLESSSAEPVTRAMPSAVEQGLKAAARAGAKKAAANAQDAKGLLRMDLQGGEVPTAA